MINFNFHEGYFVDTKLPDESSIKRSNLPLNSNDSLKKAESSTISYLVLKEVKLSHAGNYTCVPSNIKSTSVIVHVLKGKLSKKQHL